MKKYDTIFFDLDGTLTDSFEGIAKSAQHALARVGIIEEDLSVFNRFIGPPLKYSFRDFYHMNEEEVTTVVSYFRERYDSIGLFENRPYDGIYEMLDKLKAEGYTLCIASSKPQKIVFRVMEKFDLIKYFDTIGGSDFDVNRETKMDVMEYVLSQKDYGKVCMVGDRVHDAEGAKHFGIDFVGAYYGYGKDELYDLNPVFIAKHASEYCDFFCE